MNVRLFEMQSLVLKTLAMNFNQSRHLSLEIHTDRECFEFRRWKGRSTSWYHECKKTENRFLKATFSLSLFVLQSRSHFEISLPGKVTQRNLSVLVGTDLPSTNNVSLYLTRKVYEPQNFQMNQCPGCCHKVNGTDFIFNISSPGQGNYIALRFDRKLLSRQQSAKICTDLTYELPDLSSPESQTHLVSMLKEVSEISPTQALFISLFKHKVKSSQIIFSCLNFACMCCPLQTVNKTAVGLFVSVILPLEGKQNCLTLFVEQPLF